jgi:hypothetical protein
VRAAQDLAVHTGWQGALVAALLSGATIPIDLWLGRGIPGMPLWGPLAGSACAMTVAAALLVRRRTTTARFNRTAFLLNMAAIIGALWMTSGAFATQVGRWIPFQANKLGALAAALLAPDLAAGLLAIGGFVAMVVLRHLTFSPEVASHFPVGEPWTIFIYGLFSAALLVYRLHAQRLERQFLMMRSETAATERLARTFLAIRDFSNTPLQTIELSVELIRARDPELAPIVERIERSVDRLFRLHHTFSAYESHIQWTSDDVSPNAGFWGPELRPPGS